jgi:beta-xylosidase
MAARGNKVKKKNLILLIILFIALVAAALGFIFLLKYCQGNPHETIGADQIRATANTAIVEKTPLPGMSVNEKKPTPTPKVQQKTQSPLAMAAGFKDDFSQSVLDKRWFWVREKPASWSLNTQPGFLTLVCAEGDLYESHNNNSNTLLSKIDVPDFEIETKVSVKPLANFDQAGLVVYFNDDNYIKLIRIFSNGSKIELLREGRGKGSPPIQLLSNASTVYLRLIKKGSSYAGFYSTNGTDYRRVGGVSLTTEGGPKVGLIAFSLSSRQNIKASFDYFQARY